MRLKKGLKTIFVPEIFTEDQFYPGSIPILPWKYQIWSNFALTVILVEFDRYLTEFGANLFLSENFSGKFAP